MQDLVKEVISEWVALNIHQVVCDLERNRVDYSETKQKRELERKARLERGRPYDEFEKEWATKRPPEEILTWYGSWPDAKLVRPIMRP